MVARGLNFLYYCSYFIPSTLLDERPTLANLGNDHGFIIKQYYLESPTSANLGNDHEFIIKEYYLESLTSANLRNDYEFIIKEQGEEVTLDMRFIFIILCLKNLFLPSFSKTFFLNQG